MKKRLIEHDLPLAGISNRQASAHEKNIRHGHPSTLHIWWARLARFCSINHVG
jgi:putative DNA methylase